MTGKVGFKGRHWEGFFTSKTKMILFILFFLSSSSFFLNFNILFLLPVESEACLRPKAESTRCRKAQRNYFFPLCYFQKLGNTVFIFYDYFSDFIFMTYFNKTTLRYLYIYRIDITGII